MYVCMYRGGLGPATMFMCIYIYIYMYILYIYIYIYIHIYRERERERDRERDNCYGQTANKNPIKSEFESKRILNLEGGLS